LVVFIVVPVLLVVGGLVQVVLQGVLVDTVSGAHFMLVEEVLQDTVVITHLLTLLEQEEWAQILTVLFPSVAVGEVVVLSLEHLLEGVLVF
jgi:hypothetical protein